MDKIKHHMTKAPILVCPHWDWQFIVQTDASQLGLGAVLINKNPETNIKHVIAYTSCGTQGAEQETYTAYELECLAVVWALELFHWYIYGRHILVKTDNAAVTWLF